MSGSTVYAKNCATGAIAYSGTVPETVINDAIAALPNGGKVFIAAGTYTFTTDPIANVGAIGSSTVSNVELYGDGNSTILSAGTNLNGAVVAVYGPNGWFIHDLQINGNGNSQSANGAGLPLAGIELYESSNNVVEHCYVHDAKTYGIYVAGSSESVLDNLVVNSHANGIIMYGGSDDLVQGNVVNGASDVGISLSGTNENGNAPITNVLCTGNTVSNINLDISPFGQNSGGGIMVGDNGYGENITISNNQISTMTFGVSDDPYTGTNIDVTITGNTITNALYDGVYAALTSGLTISGNSFTVPSEAVAWKIDVSVTNLIIEDNYVNGVLVSGTMTETATTSVSSTTTGQSLTTNVASGSGSVSPNCPSGCSEAVGSSISVTATPSANWQFSSWTTSGASCSNGSSSNPCTFSMPNNAVTVSATFTQITQTMITGVDAGSGSVNPNCPGPSGCSEGVGSSITVTANPSANWQFSTWSTQTGISCSSNPCTFTMPNNQVTLQAIFTQAPPQTLTSRIASGSGSVSPNCPSGCSEAVGSSISVTATGASGYVFSSWTITGASCSGGSLSNPCTFTMPSNGVMVSATFTPTQKCGVPGEAVCPETLNASNPPPGPSHPLRSRIRNPMLY